MCCGTLEWKRTGGRKILTFSTGKNNTFVNQRHTPPEAVAEFLKGKSSTKTFLTGCPAVTSCSSPCRSLEIAISRGTAGMCLLRRMHI